MRFSSIGILKNVCDSIDMKRLFFATFILGIGLGFANCSNTKSSETRLQCMDRCMKEQYICAIALAPQLNNPVATTTSCISLYVICYEKCPVASTRTTTTSNNRRSSSSSSSGNRGGSSSSANSSSATGGS
ncbi:hypothetical protein EHQ71_15510 [Leptospira levettii]|nr:hypothetical protein EHQ71_15510 [Leptospira levettii]TGM92887.1 hypothetical protein EHR02_08905 [Leptospira levettii]